ncbi:MAG: hypothetical protein C0506_09385 [Anaerolinea sp.]|nr:hypothetical protein [Anaerolinea sp.]
MRAYQFKPELTSTGDLKLPAEVRALLSEEAAGAEVVLFVSDRDEDRDWKTLTAAEFLAGYDEADAIYDALV